MRFAATRPMQIDIRPIIQRLLVLGIPLLSASCSQEGAPDGTGGAAGGGRGGAEVGGGGIGGGSSGGGEVGGGGSGGAREVGSCIGGWGSDQMIGTGCLSGPYHYTRDEYRLLDGTDAQVQRYLACAEGQDCADFAELCRGMLAQMYPITGGPDARDAALSSCDPACKGPGEPGVHIVFAVTGSCLGRRPGELSADGQVRRGDPVGLFFAEAARLEAASVPAFAHLARELRAHGAPRELVDGALQARRDEVRHTRQMRALARRFGTVSVSPRVKPTGVRALELVARENAVEGCVRETYGALVAWWQAIHSDDAVVRSTMRHVAADETRHAALSQEVHGWAVDRLSAAGRRAVDEARAKAFDDLSDEVTRAEIPEPAVRYGGYPSRTAAKWLVDNLRRELT
jgi:hypothetical protein